MLTVGRLQRGGILGTIILGLSSGIAFAERCTFTLECFEGEVCSETNFSMDAFEDRLITDAETIPVSAGGVGDTHSFVGFTESAMHLLTRKIGGDARYSTHIFDGPLMVNYLGTCE